MVIKIIITVLAFISGGSAGICAGLGFCPLYKQPKNIRLQFLFMSIFIINILVIALLIFKLKV